MKNTELLRLINEGDFEPDEVKDFFSEANGELDFKTDEDGKDISKCLHRAVTMNNPTLVACLLRAGARTAVRDMHGDEPLHIAAYQCTQNRQYNLSIIEFLLKAGASVNTPNRGLDTPIGICTKGIQNVNSSTAVMYMKRKALESGVTI